MKPPDPAEVVERFEVWWEGFITEDKWARELERPWKARYRFGYLAALRETRAASDAASNLACAIFVEAIKAVADAAIIADKKYNLTDSLTAVKALANRYRETRAELDKYTKIQLACGHEYQFLDAPGDEFEECVVCRALRWQAEAERLASRNDELEASNKVVLEKYKQLFESWEKDKAEAERLRVDWERIRQDCKTLTTSLRKAESALREADICSDCGWTRTACGWKEESALGSCCPDCQHRAARAGDAENHPTHPQRPRNPRAGSSREEVPK